MGANKVLLRVRVIAVAGLCAAGLAGQAWASGHARSVIRAQRASARTVALASLQATDGSGAWGRLRVADIQTNGQTVRRLSSFVFGLEPRRSYSLEIDGLLVTSWQTGPSGIGEVELTSPGEHAAVPDALPPADVLVEASVLDGDGTVVLQGTFAIFTGQVGWHEPAYEEVITLVDETGIGAMGMARVEHEADGEQKLETRAAGLEPGQEYAIVVDGETAGVVTADPVGQAGLILSTESDDHPLPAALQPVEDIRDVQWLDAGGTVILSGTFTGSPGGNGDQGQGMMSVEGTVASLTGSGFVVDSGGGSIEVVVTPETVFEDGLSLADIAVGDSVEVKGTFDGSALTAVKVEVKNGGEGSGGDGSAGMR